MADWPLLRNSLVVADDTAPGSVYELNNDTGGVANTKTAWVQIAASLPNTISAILLMSRVSAANYKLMDIGIGGAGSEVVLVPNIDVNAGISGDSMRYLLIPVSIPAGTRISVRTQAGGTNAVVRYKMLFLTDTFIGLQAPTRWENWGADTSTSHGTSVVTSASVNTEGSWVQLVAATSFTTKWLIVMISAFGTGRLIAIDIAVGGAGSEQVILPNILFTNQNLGLAVVLPFSIPGGSRVSARNQSDVGSTTSYVSILGGA